MEVFHRRSVRENRFCSCIYAYIESVNICKNVKFKCMWFYFLNFVNNIHSTDFAQNMESFSLYGYDNLINNYRKL